MKNLKNHKNFTILQITDTHVFEHDAHKLFGVATNINFYRAVELATATGIEFDMIFLTGDVSQDETEESYDIVARTLSHFNKPIYWIPGNHDNPKKMKEVFKQHHLFINEPILSKENWVFIFLNTKYNFHDSGRLHTEDQKLLEKTLSNMDSDTLAYIVMHHPPLKVNTPLIDQYLLTNPDTFWDCIAPYPNVKNIICGHVHGDYSLIHHNVTLESSPATCLQWSKGATKLLVDPRIGFKFHEVKSSKIISTAYLYGNSYVKETKKMV